MTTYPTPNPSIYIHHGPRDNPAAFYELVRTGYPTYYAAHLDPAAKAAKALGFEVDGFIERFPGSVPNVNPGDAAHLSDFADWKSGVTGWKQMVHQAQMIKSHTGEIRRYIAYLCHPREVDRDGWNKVVTRVLQAGCAVMLELCPPPWSVRYLDPRIKLLAVEPDREGPPHRLHDFPTITAADMLCDQAAWPLFRQGWRVGDFIIHTDKEPLSIAWVRTIAGLGFRSAIPAHVLTAAAASLPTTTKGG